jgi:hypothetical protein
VDLFKARIAFKPPDFKTIADFRKDNGEAIRLVCREFVMLCKNLNLFARAFVAIDGSKFKAVNNRDRNFTRAKMKRRLTRWEHEEVLDAAQKRLDQNPDMMRIRRTTVEHPFGRITSTKTNPDQNPFTGHLV